VPYVVVIISTTIQKLRMLSGAPLLLFGFAGLRAKLSPSALAVRDASYKRIAAEFASDPDHLSSRYHPNLPKRAGGCSNV
jgi:hypothetical protein